MSASGGERQIRTNIKVAFDARPATLPPADPARRRLAVAGEVWEHTQTDLPISLDQVMLLLSARVKSERWAGISGAGGV